MKNKDGIEIKVGQVWAPEKGPEQREVIAIRGNRVVTDLLDCNVWIQDWRADNYLFHTLISDPDQPWLPLPEGYRLVTDEEREKYTKPQGIMYFDECPKGWFESTVTGLWHATKYAVPEDYEFEKPVTGGDVRNTTIPLCDTTGERFEEIGEPSEPCEHCGSYGKHLPDCKPFEWLGAGAHIDMIKQLQEEVQKLKEAND